MIFGAEVKFGNDDNEVQGDTLLGELPITFQTDSSGSWNIELDATKLTSDALGTNAFNVIYSTCSGGECQRDITIYSRLTDACVTPRYAWRRGPRGRLR